MTAALLEPLRLRDVTLRNRIVMGPMMQYSCSDGLPGPWHLAHLGSRATGGAGLVMAEQTAVSAEGRSTLSDLGLWEEAHVEPLARLAAFVASQGAVPGIQLGHSGRKASIRAPWEDRSPMTPGIGGWVPLAPSAISCGPGRPVPRALDEGEIGEVVAQFATAARRAAAAGFRFLEIHGAHGYLPHQFLSPISNRRTDGYGGDFDGRTRFVRELVAAVRAAWPAELPLAIRLSTYDDIEGGWQVEETLRLVPLLAALGVDLFDVSTGGIGDTHDYPTEPAALAPLAGRIRAEAGVAVGVGWGIGTPEVAEQVIAAGEADLVFIARGMLRDPYFATHASEALGGPSLLPVQIRR